MTTPTAATIGSLRANFPNIKLHTPDSPDYEALRSTFIKTTARPSAIARPRTAEDVQALVRACLDNGVEFVVRSGGHNCLGRTLVDNALTIDMRDIAYVKVSEDKETAKVGGGILALDLLRALGEHGLATPTGTVGSVGYVGWSTLGGYGPFSSLYGMGVDQIVGAKLVNSKGDIVDADEDLLEGIRGAGPIFGPIVEVTTKVYSLKELLVGTLVFDSSDMKAIWTTITEGIPSLTLPDPLQIQLFAMPFPGAGKVLAAIVTWVSDDHDEGRKWIDKIAGLGPCVMNMTDAKTPAKYAEDNEKLVVYGVYGRTYTMNLEAYTPETASVLAKYSENIPEGNCMISVHSLRSPKENALSVFGSRKTHHMVEIIAMTTDSSKETEVTAWGLALQKELRDRDSANVLDIAYISLLDEDEIDVDKLYHTHLPKLVGLKKKYDPSNVFKHASPKLAV